MSYNPKWEEMQSKMLEGKRQGQAYREVYKNKTQASADSKASALVRNRKFISQFEEKLKEIRQIDILTVEERQKILANIALADSTKAGDKTKAVDVLNKMDGLYSDAVKADTNININLQGDLKDWSE